MRALFFIISLLFTISGWGQIQTAITKVKSPVIYENGKNGFIKKGIEIVILSEHIGDSLCEFVYNKNVGKININNLVVDKELDNFLFSTERMEKARKIETEAFNDRAKIITPLLLSRLKEKKLFYKGIITKRTGVFKSVEEKKGPFSTVADGFINYGDSVSVFYYHKSKNNSIAGVTNNFLCGFIDASDLLMDSTSIDSLHYINITDKNTYAVEFRSNRLAEIDKYIKRLAKEKAEAERQQIILNQDKLYKKGNLITIEDIYFDMNSAGLLEPKIRFVNNSSKDIKYITFNFYFKNSVDDVIYNTINKSEKQVSCQVTGYINGYEKGYGSWDSEFYNTTAKTIHISSIHIIYRDGSTRTIGSQKCKELTNEY